MAHTKSRVTNTVVVGAGPYGLSIAAHLRARGLEHRIFGDPLRTWRTAMPKGMLLKSDGFASNLSAPLPASTLADYCRTHGLPYHDTDIAVPLETFIDYGLDFQRRFVPHLEPGHVAEIAALKHGYRVALDNGDEIEARHVVVAAGITHFATIPSDLDGLPACLVTHSSAHQDLNRFCGKDVTVFGGGSSAVELAVGLAGVGARSRLIVRAPSVKFASPPNGKSRGFVARLRHPSSGLGPGIRSRLCCDVPDLFRLLPVRARAEIVRRHLGPSSPWHLRAPFTSTVEVMTSRRLRKAESIGHRLRLDVSSELAETPLTIETDHVICATGYRADLARLRFIDEKLRNRVRTINDAPALSVGFESSAPGLFFAGIAGAMTFGPLLRFMYGSDFAARRITKRLAETAR